MIYSLKPSEYPQGDALIEELVYKDLNEVEWRIARSPQGFVVKYFGKPSLKGEDFDCEILPEKFLKIKNTGVVFFLTTDFNSFCDVRTVLTENHTDFIWTVFKALFSERFKRYPVVLLSELA